MQSTLQQADPTSDTHEAIVALMRGETARVASDAPEINVRPPERTPAAAMQVPVIEPVLRPSPLDGQAATPVRAGGTRAGKAMRFVLTVCAGIAATIGWQAYGDEARQLLESYAPQLGVQLPWQSQGGFAEAQNSAAAETAATEPAAEPAATAPAAAAAQPAEAAPVAAAVPPEVAQSIDAMSREIASLKQTIEQLKTGQQQMSRDLAKALEERAKPAPKPAKQASTSSSSSQRSPGPPLPTSPAPRSATAAPAQGGTYGQAPAQQTYGPGAARDVYGPRDVYQPRDVYAPRDVYNAPARQLPPEPGFPGNPRPPVPMQ